MRAVLAVLAIALLPACGSVTHPRYAPELGQRWPECERIVVIEGTLDTEVKNFRTAEWFADPSGGNTNAQQLGQAVRKVLRDEAGREPRIDAEAQSVLGTDAAGLRAIADGMLAHARAFMARDPAYAHEVLSGLAADPEVVPDALRRHYDAVVVVGGRSRYETDRERARRLTEIAVRNAWVYPVVMVSALIPPLLPFSVQLMNYRTSYWREAPNETYASIAIFDAATGRLLYANDWFDTEKISDFEDWNDVAHDLLEPIVHVRAEDSPPLGKRPDGWDSPFAP